MQAIKATELKFPLADVSINIVLQKREISGAVYHDWYGSHTTQHEFAMDVPEVAWYYAANGKEIEIIPYEGVTVPTIELYLNGSVYGAILHQRGILPFHGSCFLYSGKAIMLCGESGAGKSSLTTAFCLDGAEFLTDDVTPVIFENGHAYILPMSDRVKLWEDSLAQLNQESLRLSKIRPDMEKFYYPISVEKKDPVMLNYIFLINVHQGDEVQFKTLSGAEKFSKLRNQVYRWEFLESMKASEINYFPGLVRLASSLQMVEVSRPAEIPIADLRQLLGEKIEALG